MSAITCNDSNDGVGERNNDAILDNDDVVDDGDGAGAPVAAGGVSTIHSNNNTSNVEDANRAISVHAVNVCAPHLLTPT
jgi:hypothetical protein